MISFVTCLYSFVCESCNEKGTCMDSNAPSSGSFFIMFLMPLQFILFPFYNVFDSPAIYSSN
jgi:hypothetical protein